MNPSADLDRFLDDLSLHIHDLSSEMTLANDRWEERELTFPQARASFAAVLRDLQSQIAILVTNPPPSSLLVILIPVQDSLDRLQLEAQAVIDGLEAPDNGSQRIEAMSAWSAAVDAFEVAASPTETTTTTTISSSTTLTPVSEVENTVTDAVEDIRLDNDATEADPNDAWVGATLLIAVLAYALGRRRSGD